MPSRISILNLESARKVFDNAVRAFHPEIEILPFEHKEVLPMTN